MGQFIFGGSKFGFRQLKFFACGEPSKIGNSMATPAPYTVRYRQIMRALDAHVQFAHPAFRAQGDLRIIRRTRLLHTGLPGTEIGQLATSPAL